MDIALQEKAIIFRLSPDSANLFALMHFVNNSFKNVKYFSGRTVVLDTEDEVIRKRYLIRWAYKIFYKSEKYNNSVSFKRLNNSLHLPIYIISTEHKHIAKTISITIEHINTNNELRIRCNEYNQIIAESFKKLFKDSFMFSVDKRIFKIKVQTKYDLAILKNILSRKKISGVSVVFITHGLNFSKLHAQEAISEELAYKQKLAKSYKILSIHKGSTFKEIKDNYRKMLKKYHPDKVSNEGSETISLYTRRFQVIQEAYSLIKEHHRI
jgi:hypothetical protein